jgi:hypothetical protein
VSTTTRENTNNNDCLPLSAAITTASQAEAFNKVDFGYFVKLAQAEIIHDSFMAN